MTPEMLTTLTEQVAELVQTYSNNYPQFQRATYNETRVQNMVHYSREEYDFYKSNHSPYVTAQTDTLDKYYLFILLVKKVMG